MLDNRELDLLSKMMGPVAQGAQMLMVQEVARNSIRWAAGQLLRDMHITAELTVLNDLDVVTVKHASTADAATLVSAGIAAASHRECPTVKWMHLSYLDGRLWVERQPRSKAAKAARAAVLQELGRLAEEIAAYNARATAHNEALAAQLDLQLSAPVGTVRGEN